LYVIFPKQIGYNIKKVRINEVANLVQESSIPVIKLDTPKLKNMIDMMLSRNFLNINSIRAFL